MNAIQEPDLLVAVEVVEQLDLVEEAELGAFVLDVLRIDDFLEGLAIHNPQGTVGETSDGCGSGHAVHESKLSEPSTIGNGLDLLDDAVIVDNFDFCLALLENEVLFARFSVFADHVSFLVGSLL